GYRCRLRIERVAAVCTSRASAARRQPSVRRDVRHIAGGDAVRDRELPGQRVRGRRDGAAARRDMAGERSHLCIETIRPSLAACLWNENTLLLETCRHFASTDDEAIGRRADIGKWKACNQRQRASIRRLEHLDVAGRYDGGRFHEILEIAVSCFQRDRVTSIHSLQLPDEGVVITC